MHRMSFGVAAAAACVLAVFGCGPGYTVRSVENLDLDVLYIRCLVIGFADVAKSWC